MFININGKTEEVKIQLSLADLIAARGLCADNVVVEHNRCIIPKLKWQDTLLGENDNIEIVSFVGGG